MELLNDFSGRNRISGCRPKYDWDLWFKPGQVVRLTKGVDFDVKIDSFRMYVWQRAKKRGLKVETRVFGNAIELKIVNKEV